MGWALGIELGRAFTALIVDDNQLVRTMIGRTLYEAGVTDLLYASSGRDAYELIRSEEPEVTVVFCDVVMPEMDGVELVRAVAQLRVPPAFVFLHGTNGPLLSAVSAVAAARGLTVLGTVEKPLTPAATQEILENYGRTKPKGLLSAVTAATVENLAAAIDDEQICLHFQPKVNIATQAIEGVEALVRWEHPTDGWIPPAAFVRVAEKTGLIEPLTERVVQLAISQAVAWRANGRALRISINLSAHVLTDLSLPDRLAAQVAAANLTPQALMLEVTESGLFKNEADGLDILARLHVKGFALSIDDFGTGFSSLDQLRKVPFTELKIDRAFVDGAAASTKMRGILEASVSLAQRLDLHTVAEGVEALGDWHLIERLGINSAQGYKVARPMPAAEIPGWCDAWELRQQQARNRSAAQRA
jgi:EAL domain-containing protein (putative c-di-GMP-specific phosphodiesterase class I)/AmiR/NasT family two-component response regulator